MASLPPLGGPPPALSSIKGKNRSERASARSSDPELAAQQAQRDATQQIAAANQSVEAARHDADVQIDQIHDSYDSRSEEEYARAEAAFEKQRLKGYEQLKELKRSQDAEMSRVRRESERNLDKLNHYYTDTTYNTQRAGDEKLREIEVQQARTVERARQNKNEDSTLETDQFRRQYEELKTGHEEKLAKLQTDNTKEYDRIRETTNEATEKAHETFTSKYQEKLKTNDEVLLDLENRASEGIREVRRDTTQKLAAYSSRQNDPFYRMLDMNVKVKDDGDHLVLTATIPEHEQKHVSVSVKGNQLVLTGYRRSEEKLDLEPGRSQGTNAYQSFLETFPITWPVDANKMTREFDGDQLTVRVPKKNDFAYHSEAQAKVQPPRARLERPHFPENLPHVSQDPYATADDEGKTSRKRKGSGTLV